MKVARAEGFEAFIRAGQEETVELLLQALGYDLQDR
jgi:hypothetical protein